MFSAYVFAFSAYVFVFSEQRTRVIDDDSDYFQLDSVWLTPKEREQLKKYKKEIQDKKHVSKLNRKVNFDFAGEWLDWKFEYNTYSVLYTKTF